MSTDGTGSASYSLVLKPDIFTAQYTQLAALFNNIELLSMALHWTKASDIGIKGQVAIGFDPAADAAVPDLDSIMRLPNSWIGMTWSDKKLEFVWPPDTVRGQVAMTNASFFPAASMRIVLAIAGAAGNTVAGRLWLTATVQVSGQK